MASAGAWNRQQAVSDYEKAFRGFTPREWESFAPAAETLKATEDLFARWKAGGPANSVALVGCKGSAGPLAMHCLQQRFSKTVKCTHVVLERYAIAHDGLAGALGEQLGQGRSADLDGLIKEAIEGDPRAIFLDSCHDLFIRRVGGFEPLFDLQHLMAATRGKLLWITLWSPFTWYYLDRTINLSRYFDEITTFTGLPAPVCERWVKLKHEATGYAVEFGPEKAPPETSGERWLPSSMRSLFDRVSHGDIEAASAAWLGAARPAGEKLIRINGFEVFDPASLETIREEELYILCSILFHRDISLEYLAEDMNLTDIDARMYVNHLAARGLIGRADTAEDFTLAPAAVPAVVRLLNEKNLISIKGPYAD